MKAKARINPKVLENAQAALLAGRPADTLSLLAESPSVEPVLLLRGGALAALSRYKEAAACFAAVFRAQPRQANARYNLALCQKALGQFEEARGHLAAIVKAQPGHVSAILNLNAVLAELGQPKEQEALLTRALALKPEEPRLRRNLAVLLFQRQRYEEALELAETLAEAEPPDPGSLDLLGLIRLELGKKRNDETLVDSAAGLFERALALAPETLDYSLHLGGALNAQDKTAERALSHFSDLAARHPDHAGVHLGLALAHLGQGRAADARLSLERAVSCDPENAAAQHKLAIVNMALGDFERGSRAYAWRWRIHEPPRWRDHDLPRWDGSQLTAGRLLVWSEQGLGDELLAYSWLPHLATQGTAFGVECDPRLVGLLTRAFPEAEIAPNDDPRLADLSDSAYTAHCPAYDLLSRTRPWTQPATVPFLSGDPQRRESFRERLAARHAGPKIGISWFSQGSSLALGKSLSLSTWQPLLAQLGALFVNLQYGDSVAEFEAACAAAGAEGYSDPELDRREDIEGLLALIESLDLVVTVANVTGHFAGALGTPCWMLLGKEPHWHWGAEGESVPFYPSLTALRASERGGWDGVIAEAAQRLEQVHDGGGGRR